MLVNLLRKTWRSSVSYSDNYGRDVIEQWIRLTASSKPLTSCLDIGCGTGMDLELVKNICGDTTIYGLDIDETHFEQCALLGIQTKKVNLESEQIPFSSETFDLVIANQVFEHLKNWAFVLSEVARVLKPGGVMILGVPNLASFHNRILLMVGQQPTCIDTAGMHVRGFTYPGLTSVIEYKNIFKIKDCQGRVFPPLPRRIGLTASYLWPKASSGLFLLCERTGDPDEYRSVESIQKMAEFSLA